jgi:hypothetical protein
MATDTQPFALRLGLGITDGYTSPDTTVFGEIPDYGPSDWDDD